MGLNSNLCSVSVLLLKTNQITSCPLDSSSPCLYFSPTQEAAHGPEPAHQSFWTGPLTTSYLLNSCNLTVSMTIYNILWQITGLRVYALDGRFMKVYNSRKMSHSKEKRRNVDSEDFTTSGLMSMHTYKMLRENPCALSVLSFARYINNTMCEGTSRRLTLTLIMNIPWAQRLDRDSVVYQKWKKLAMCVLTMFGSTYTGTYTFVTQMSVNIKAGYVLQFLLYALEAMLFDSFK